MHLRGIIITPQSQIYEYSFASERIRTTFCIHISVSKIVSPIIRGIARYSAKREKSTRLPINLYDERQKTL